MENDANSSSSNQSFTSLMSGQKLAGCYVLNREISSESGLSVWLAHDEVLGKEVTLHFVPVAVLADPRGMAELRQEVKRNRQLIHPNILRVYDFVEDGGLAAVSMDRFDGESLATALKRKGSFTAEEIQPWVQQLAGTLDDAHRVQLFHRDISPSNIFLKPGGGLFITNFGVSRCIRDAMERTRSLQNDALHIAYMSPQQVDGEKASKSDDVYGLGVLVTELLSGKTPFSGPEIVTAIRAATPPKMSELLGAAVPEAWEGMVAACLAKKPDQRPASCAAAVALLSAPVAAATAGASVVSVVPAASQNQPDVKQAAFSISPTAAAALAASPSVAAAAAPAVIASGVRSVERRVTFGKAEGSTLPEKITPPPSDPVVRESEAKLPQLPPVPPSDAAKSKVPGAKSNLSTNFPELSRPKSKWPAVGVGIAAALVAFGVVQKMKQPKVDGVADAVTSISPDASPAVDPGLRDISGSEEKQGGELPKPEEVKSALPKPENLVIEPRPPANAGTVANGSADLPLPDETKNSAATAQSNDAALLGPAAVNLQPGSTKTPKKALIGVNPSPATPAKAPEQKVAEQKAAEQKASDQKKTESAPVEPTAPPVEQPVVTQIPNTIIAAPSVKLPELPKITKVEIPAGADAAALEKALAERAASEAALKQAAGAAEQAQQEIEKLSENSKKAQEVLSKTLQERRKAAAPLIKENETLIAERKKLEEGMAKAEAAAVAARKAADASKAALDTLLQQSGPKLDAVKKVDEEMKQIALQIAEQSTQLDALGKNQTQAATLRQQATLALQQVEKDKATIRAAVEKAKAGAAEAMRAQNMAKIAELAKQAQPLEAEIKKSSDALAMLKDLGDAGVAASKPIAERLAATTGQLKALRDEMAKLGAPEGGNVNIPQPPAPTPAPPPKTTATPTEPAEAGANSVGMRFVQVGDVDFAVHLVTRRDYEAFASEKGLKGGSWRSPGFAQEPDHPVVNVTWKEADAFCKWLTDRERKSGQLKAGESYRLPTDIEWSKAVGLPPEKGVTAEERDLGVDDVFPWGLAWPPPPGAGNYAGEETDSEVKLQGYRDDYQWTSPVGKFKPNAVGLFDMGGNVWQWTSDYFNESKEQRVLRGGSWYNGGVKPSLLASCRYSAKPDASNDTYGFRVVRTRDGVKTSSAKPK